MQVTVESTGTLERRMRVELPVERIEKEVDTRLKSVGKTAKIKRLKAGVMAALTVLTVVAGYSALDAIQQRDLADQARARAVVEAQTATQTSDFMVGLFEVSDPSEAKGNTITAREILDRGAERIHGDLDARYRIEADVIDAVRGSRNSCGRRLPRSVGPGHGKRGRVRNPGFGDTIRLASNE